jgi:hypothetical protein
MSLAKFRSVYGKNGSGRFVVSEGTAPAAYLLPHEGLPTLYTDLEDSRFEIVITKGTLLSVVADSNGDARLTFANGTTSNVTTNDGTATPTTLTVPHNSVVIGAAQYDLYRPFDKGTSQGGGWITEGYVEWPLISGLNSSLVPGNYIRSDGAGRPVFWTTGSDRVEDIVGKVVEVEGFATNFDDGLLSYMLLPSDPGALKLVYELAQTGTYQNKLGIRANLDVTNVVGAFRAILKK